MIVDSLFTSVDSTDDDKLFENLPAKVYPEKLRKLLNKRVNKNASVKDVFEEVCQFFQDEGLTYKEVTQKDDPMRTLKIGDKMVAIVVEDYSRFNNSILPKKYVETIHFGWRDKGMRAIWIKKFEWEDLRKRTVLKSLILHACGKTPRRIFARNTYAMEIESKSLREFFNLSSFYGYRNASFAACLRDKKTDELLMAMSYGFPFYGKNKYGENSVECIRAASVPCTAVVGGMSKIMKFIVGTFGDKFSKALFYTDLAHYNSNSIEKAGYHYDHFAGGASHNVWVKTGAMFMRTPMLHQPISYLIRKGEIAAIPDVGNDAFILDVKEYKESHGW
ncbi:Uncharacterised protein [uncultured archaeon]|nr:Uncharacterised protein [uncultured archaeon]